MGAVAWNAMQICGRMWGRKRAGRTGCWRTWRSKRRGHTSEDRAMMHGTYVTGVGVGVRAPEKGAWGWGERSGGSGYGGMKVWRYGGMERCNVALAESMS